MLVLGAALIGGVLWLASGGSFRQAYDVYRAYSDESVSGLNLNAPVKYNGVEVGKVQEIRLDPANPERVNLLFAIERGTPIKVDTVAVLKTQGLTGIAYVELSGGMMKRASLARALALDPELPFLDEPTAGLDPVSAGGVDDLVLKLRDQFGLTIVMITHDLDLLWQVADRVAVLAEGTVQGIGSMSELSQMDNPAVRQFFGGARGRAAQEQAQRQTAAQTSRRIERPSSKRK